MESKKKSSLRVVRTKDTNDYVLVNEKTGNVLVGTSTDGESSVLTKFRHVNPEEYVATTKQEKYSFYKTALYFCLSNLLEMKNENEFLAELYQQRYAHKHKLKFFGIEILW